MATYETISGIIIEYEPDAETLAFVERVAALASKPRTTANDLIVLIYSGDNPLLGPYPFGGRGAVTKETLANPAYAVLADMLFRKEMAERGVTPEALAARYTMPASEAQEVVGISRVAMRKAALEGRISTWVKGGAYYFDPQEVERFAGAGDKRRAKVREASGGAELSAVVGNAPGGSLYVKGAEVRESARLGEHVVSGSIEEGWTRLLVKFSKESRGEKRVWVYELEPGTDDEAIDVKPFGVKGRFRIAAKLDGKKATDAWRSA